MGLISGETDHFQLIKRVITPDTINPNVVKIDITNKRFMMTPSSSNSYFLKI